MGSGRLTHAVYIVLGAQSRSLFRESLVAVVQAAQDWFYSWQSRFELL